MITNKKNTVRIIKIAARAEHLGSEESISSIHKVKPMTNRSKLQLSEPLGNLKTKVLQPGPMYKGFAVWVS